MNAISRVQQARVTGGECTIHHVDQCPDEFVVGSAIWCRVGDPGHSRRIAVRGSPPLASGGLSPEVAIDSPMSPC